MNISIFFFLSIFIKASFSISASFLIKIDHFDLKTFSLRVSKVKIMCFLRVFMTWAANYGPEPLLGEFQINILNMFK